MIQGWCLSPARIHVQGACGSYIVLPCVPAARPLRVAGGVVFLQGVTFPGVPVMR